MLPQRTAGEKGLCKSDPLCNTDDYNFGAPHHACKLFSHVAAVTLSVTALFGSRVSVLCLLTSALPVRLLRFAEISHPIAELLPDVLLTIVLALGLVYVRLVAPDETVILLHPSLPLVGVAIWMERGCQQNDCPVRATRLPFASALASSRTAVSLPLPFAVGVTALAQVRHPQLNHPLRPQGVLLVRHPAIDGNPRP